jgi:hypothetical protein
MFTRTVSVGPGAANPSDSPWLRLDEWAGGQVGFQAVVTGTVTAYTISTTFDDPNDLLNPVSVPTWDSTLTGVAGASTTASGVIPCVPRYIKATLTTGTGTVALTVTQSLSVPF